MRGYEACLQENLLIAAVTASGDGAQTYLARVHSFNGWGTSIPRGTS